ncbi:helix-turn-helix domain-containing protein [Pullulanibacillus sp. KACC 23026]|uniref:helix-turn-helix domain-containing protein n=1 Tax=Pullulanibacillus sp. KACC 23026 TaxID=3028315 RepID=UPI0023AF07F4|nr:helix-turn-helix domain-containing protein [Pullulanibacillus sp. KACC 23026]WEG11273.1 helix-turn-helix domain-containing protein [Pullulanibacillus sp. KACC 23026]
MDTSKVGKLLLTLRKEKKMTQKEVASTMGISDKTISKWERGLGCPDVSLLGDLSNILGVNIEKILLGDLEPNDADGGNMRRIKFFVCSNCGSVMTSLGEAEISCCGRKLTPLLAKPEDDEHAAMIETIDQEYYITFQHDMTKNHFISFVAYVSYDRVLIVKLYPEQNAELRIPKMSGGTLYTYCNQHGLWVKEKKGRYY